MIELCLVFFLKAVRCTIHQRRAWFVGILDSTLARTFVPLALPISQLAGYGRDRDACKWAMYNAALLSREGNLHFFKKQKKIDHSLYFLI
jgi:hypothetical protein